MACVCNCNVISSNLIILLYSLLLFLCSFSFNLAAGYDLGWAGRDDNYNNKMKYSDISWILLQTSSPQPPSAVEQSALELQTKVIPRYSTILQSRRTPVPSGLLVLTGRPVNRPAGRPAKTIVLAGQKWPKLNISRNMHDFA